MVRNPPAILGPLLFNIFLCDLFQFFHNVDIANYTDENTPHSSNINLNKVLHNLEKISNTLFHGNIITQGILSLFPSVKFLSFFNDSF